MIFLIERSILSEALRNVSKAVADRAALKALEGIRFSLADSLLELTGYDLEIGIRTTVPVKSADKGSFIANAAIFSEMVAKMPDGELSIEIDDNYMVTIERGNTSYNLLASSADDYPELPERGTSEPVTMPQGVLRSMINQTKFAASQLDIKPILKGELFEISNNSLTIAAIDGYRLAVRTEPIAYNEDISFVVPAKNLDEVAKLLSDSDDELCSMVVSKKHILFEIGNYLVNSRLLEGEFHPYRSAIPESFNTEVIVERTALIRSLERCMLLINEKNPSPVRCTFENNQLKIKCVTGSLGKVYDEIDTEQSGVSLEIGFKCRFFLDPLKAISDEKVRLRMTSGLQPLKIVPMEGESFTYLVLPVRLPKE